MSTGGSPHHTEQDSNDDDVKKSNGTGIPKNTDKNEKKESNNISISLEIGDSAFAALIIFCIGIAIGRWAIPTQSLST